MQNTYTQTPVLDPRYYQGMTSVTVQRWIADQQADIVRGLLKPAMDANGGWLVYAIDDAMHYEEIPLFNRGRHAFANDRTQANIRYMLNAADLVVVTTDYIKRYYNRKYGVPIQNIVAVPNLLPKWWFGDRYDPERKLEQFKANKARPRIGIVSSLSHYNIDGIRQTADGKAARATKDQQTGAERWTDQDGNEVDVKDTQPILDDLDLVVDMIRETASDFQWVFFGYAPPKLKDLIDRKRIEYHQGVPITNYPSVIENLRLQAIVAPIRDMEFNRCKSHIKFLECCAVGVPLFASRSLPYTGVMKDEFLFSDGKELRDRLTKLKFSSAGAYRSMVEDNWRWLNSPKVDGDFNIRNGWLEDNLNIWIDLFRLRPKAMSFSMNMHFQRKAAEEKARAERLVFDGGEGTEILK